MTVETVPATDGIYPDLGNEAYQRGPGLSASGAKLILSSPAKYRQNRITPFKPTPAMDFGTVWHTEVFGGGGVTLIAECGTRSAKAFKDIDTKENRDADKTPILAHEYETIKAMVPVLRQHELAAELLSEGVAEQSGYVVDPQTGVPLRWRMDWLTQYRSRTTIIDGKTAVSADPKEFKKAAYNLGYHIQFAFYVTSYAYLQGEMPAMFFIVQEKEPPYLVSVCEFDADAYDAGLADMRKAIDLYRRCTDTDTWPGYPPGINTISLPPWHRPRQPTADLYEGIA